MGEPEGRTVQITVTNFPEVINLITRRLDDRFIDTIENYWLKEPKFKQKLELTTKYFLSNHWWILSYR
jgi:hypothetical protein